MIHIQRLGLGNNRALEDFGHLWKFSDIFGNLWICLKTCHSQDKSLAPITQKKLAGVAKGGGIVTNETD